MRPRQRERATALVVVLGVLSLLSTMAISFARLMAVEADASVHQVEQTRASLAAHAGVEHALALIDAAATSPVDGPASPWFYRGQPGLTTGHGVPLREATRPSLEGSLNESDRYRVKILDSASMIDLNAPIDPRRTGSQQPLVRMLTTLGWVLDPSDPPITAAEAVAIVVYRQTLPGGIYRDRREILEVPGGAIDARDLERLGDRLTTFAWADPAVCAPGDPALAPAIGQPVSTRVPTGEPILLPRRPISINTASLEVLAAAVAGLEAWTVDEGVARMSAGSVNWSARGVGTRTEPISTAGAMALALAIDARRQAAPFAGAEDLESFLDEQVLLGVLDADQAAVVLANADPNVDTHRANPDEVVGKRIDKFDLVVSTTEFCFCSMGVFEIESHGQVVDDGEVVAESSVRLAVRAYEVVRHTSQAHFEAGNAGTYSLEEPVLYHPEAAIIATESLYLGGSVQVRGAAGSVHSNADLTLGGGPYVEKNATAVGTFDQGSQAQVDGLAAGGQPPVRIPEFNPAQFVAKADVVFKADGRVVDGAGNLVGTGSYADFGHDPDIGRWSWSGGQQLGGILFFEGDVRITSNTNATWVVSLITTGSIVVKGKPNMSPDPRFRLTVIAGTDLSISGTPGAQVSGVLYAGEQIDLGGNTDFYGAALSKGRASIDDTVQSNKVHGSVIFNYNRDLFPIPFDWVYTELPTVVTYPEANAWATIGGTHVHLPSTSDADGWISIATRTINRSYLGGVPLTDRLLARWKDGTLDAELGEGPKGMLLDAAGPIVGPVVGETVGHLLPDGYFSEEGAVGAFEAAGNMGPVQGTIAFWFKPAWSSESNKSHHLVGLSRTDDVGTQSFQFAAAGEFNAVWSDTTGFHFERSTIENPDAQRLIHSDWRPVPGRWVHVALVYDIAAEDGADGIAVYVDGVALPGGIRDFNGAYLLTPDEMGRSPITPGNLLRLGERPVNDYQMVGTSAEGTYDELMLHHVAEDAAWAAALHGEGRYYADGPVEFESGTLSIPVGAEVLHAAWTVRTPADWVPAAPVLRLEEDGVPFAETDDPAGVGVGHLVGGDVRYRVIFLARPTGAGIDASPVVDDITIAFRLPGRRILAWEEF